MASLTPTSDPVTASPTPPVSDPIVASDRPDKPIMGNIVSLSRDDWSAWTGGKPAPGSWFGLNPAPPMTLRHQINSAQSMPPPHKRDTTFVLIKTIQSTSIEGFEDLKAAIKAHHPSQYAGKNLEALAADYRKGARELMTAGQYDHNLTLTMLKTFLLAGGAGNEDFHFPLRSTKQKLDQALLDIGCKEKSAAHAHMVAEKLTFHDICCQEAEDAYRTQFDSQKGMASSKSCTWLMSELLLRRLAMSQLPLRYLLS